MLSLKKLGWSSFCIVLGILLLVYFNWNIGLVIMISPFIIVFALICILYGIILPFTLEPGQGTRPKYFLAGRRADGSDPRAKEGLGRDIENLNLSSIVYRQHRHLGGSYDPRLNPKKKK